MIISVDDDDKRNNAHSVSFRGSQDTKNTSSTLFNICGREKYDNGKNKKRTAMFNRISEISVESEWKTQQMNTKTTQTNSQITSKFDWRKKKHTKKN